MAENIIAPSIAPVPRPPQSMHLAAGLADDYIASLDKRMDGVKHYVSTGFATLDKYIPGWLHEGHLIILAGRPAMGKSGLAQQIGENVAEGGRTSIIFTLEMSSHELTERSIARRSGIPVPDLKTSDGLSADQWARVGDALKQYRPLPLLIDDTTFDINALISKAQASSESLEKSNLPPLGCIIVDHIQLAICQAASRNLEVGQVTSALKRLSKQLKVPVIALSQLNRGVESRVDKRPTMADLRESGNIEQDADSIVFLYRDEYYNPKSADKGIAEIIVAKNRHGPTGMTRMGFVGERIMFGDLTNE